MSELSTFRSENAYTDFARSAKQHQRYFRTAESEAFLETLLQTVREHPIPIGTDLWRARPGHETQEWPVDNGEGGEDMVDREAPYPPEQMGAPPAEKVSDGRANPRRIPYLYLAEFPETALAEVRPWINQMVSVGCFRAQRDLRLVDCSRTPWSPDFINVTPTGFTIAMLKADRQDIPPEMIEKAVWEEVDEAFSRPVQRDDEAMDYLPTQILAEFFRVNKFDGVAYRSSLGPGRNIVLFDLKAMTMFRAVLYRVRGLKYETSEQASASFVPGRPRVYS